MTDTPFALPRLENAALLENPLPSSSFSFKLFEYLPGQDPDEVDHIPEVREIKTIEFLAESVFWEGNEKTLDSKLTVSFIENESGDITKLAKKLIAEDAPSIFGVYTQYTRAGGAAISTVFNGLELKRFNTGVSYDYQSSLNRFGLQTESPAEPTRFQFNFTYSSFK